MRTRWMLGMIVAAALAGPAAQAQETNESGIRTETQERLRSGPPKIDWFNLLERWVCSGCWDSKKNMARTVITRPQSNSAD